MSDGSDGSDGRTMRRGILSISFRGEMCELCELCELCGYVLLSASYLIIGSGKEKRRVKGSMILLISCRATWR